MTKVKRLTVKKLNRKELHRFGIDDDIGWYINDPNGDVDWVGPYPTKMEAMEIKKGLEYFWRKEVC